MSFLDNLRMSRIFSGNKPFGLPDLDAGQTNPDLVSSLLNRTVPFLQQNRIGEIGNGMMNSNSTTEQNRLALAGQMQAPGPRQFGNTVAGPGNGGHPLESSASFFNRVSSEKANDKARIAQGNEDAGNYQDSRRIAAENKVQSNENQDARLAQIAQSLIATKEAKQAEFNQQDKIQGMKNDSDEKVKRIDVDQKQKEVDDKNAKEKAAADKLAQTQQEANNQTAQSTLDVINRIIDKNGQLTPYAQPVIGGSRFMQAHRLPGNVAADADVKNLISKQVLDYIGKLKSQSRTGATGFGNMSNKDLSVLESAASTLDPFMGENDFASRVKTIRDKIEASLKGNTGIIGNPSNPNASGASKWTHSIEDN